MDRRFWGMFHTFLLKERTRDRCALVTSNETGPTGVGPTEMGHVAPRMALRIPHTRGPLDLKIPKTSSR